jgi:hypothetical protein
MEDVDPYIEFSKLQNFSKKCKCIGPSMMYYVATKNSDRRGKSKDAQILFVHIMFSGPTGFKKNAPTYTLGNNEIPGTAYLQQKVPIKSLGQ